jgi:hypothetical protein
MKTARTKVRPCRYVLPPIDEHFHPPVDEDFNQPNDEDFTCLVTKTATSLVTNARCCWNACRLFLAMYHLTFGRVPAVQCTELSFTYSLKATYVI